jgi:hypothetical protein
MESLIYGEEKVVEIGVESKAQAEVEDISTFREGLGPNTAGRSTAEWFVNLDRFNRW